MIYKGTVSQGTRRDGQIITPIVEWPDEFNPERIQIGYTYKASKEIDKSLFDEPYNVGSLDSVTDDSYIRIGDLLIATGTEDSVSGYIDPDTLIWTHISSGYHADYVPELSANQTEDSDGNVLGAEIRLTSAHAAENETGDLGTISITSNNESLTVKADSNAIKIGMVWGSF